MVLEKECHEDVPAFLGRNRINSGSDHQPSTRDMTTLALEIRKTRLSYNLRTSQQDQTFSKFLSAVTLSELKQMVVILEAKPCSASMQSMKSCR